MVYGPSGVVEGANQQPLQYNVQPCASVHPLATPAGLAMIVRAYNLDDRLLVLGADMGELWDRGFDIGIIAGREFPNWFGHDMIVDNNGNILTFTRYWRNSQQYRGVQIAVLNGVNGTRASVLYTDQLDATVSFGLTTDGVGLSQGRIYLAAHVCGSNQCNGSDTLKLFAVPAAGVGMDYPRARLLGQSPVTPTSHKYVALGDSFSAGEGVEPFISPSDSNGCHRSERAYAKLLDEAPALNLDFQAFVACSGATTWHVQNGQNGEPPQLNALSTDTDIVTITIGGNDIGFERFARACFVGLNCEESLEYQEAMATLGGIDSSLDGLFGAIDARIGPQTRVLVVGYPRMMPYGMDEFPNCLYMSGDERVAARTVTRGLNEALQSAVGRAGSQFEFVDADVNLYGVRTSPFAGHELCSDDNYFNGISLPFGYSFHPNRMGQTAYAELVKEWLLVHP